MKEIELEALKRVLADLKAANVSAYLLSGETLGVRKKFDRANITYWLRGDEPSPEMKAKICKQILKYCGEKGIDFPGALARHIAPASKARVVA